jgi:hypothetical protein
VSTAAELDDKCRSESGSPICGGVGFCNCGRCQCPSDSVQNEFCEDENAKNANCPVDSDGKLCSGQGECRHGTCSCEDGFIGSDCSCKDDPAPCTDENGLVCSGNGACECSKCACNSGFTGATCAIEQSSSDFNRESNDGEILPSDNDDSSTSTASDPSHQHGEGTKDSASLTTTSFLSTVLLLIGAYLLSRV